MNTKNTEQKDTINGTLMLFHFVIRTAKEDSVFAYFTLESHEGLCFYSTREESLGKEYRDIDLQGPLHFKADVLHIIEKLQARFPVQILLDEDIEDKSSPIENQKTVYGPVKSWRFGNSVGIDPIFYTSTCSFNCIYCQLGNIKNHTTQIKEYVPTAKVIHDFKGLMKGNPDLDIITFSGSGEPTLAENLGEIAKAIRDLLSNSNKKVPITVLTNGTLLSNPIVQENLKTVDKVTIKLDAVNDKELKQINRPCEGITFDSLIKGILDFRSSYKGEVEIQTMFMPLNMDSVKEMAELLLKIKPDSVQLNTPKRPYPLSWHRENRGNHECKFDYEVKQLKTISKEEAGQIEKTLRELTKLNILSIYRE